MALEILRRYANLSPKALCIADYHRIDSYVSGLNNMTDPEVMRLADELHVKVGQLDPSQPYARDSPIRRIYTNAFNENILEVMIAFEEWKPVEGDEQPLLECMDAMLELDKDAYYYLKEMLVWVTVGNRRVIRGKLVELWDKKLMTNDELIAIIPTLPALTHREFDYLLLALKPVNDEVRELCRSLIDKMKDPYDVRCAEQWLTFSGTS